MNPNPPLMNGTMSPSNNSSVSTYNRPSYISRNTKVCSLQKPIHKKIKKSYLSKTQSIFVSFESDVMRKQVKILGQKTWHTVILEYFLKDKSMNYFVSEIDIITTLSTHEIISQNQFQMKVFDKFLLKQNVDKKLR